MTQKVEIRIQVLPEFATQFFLNLSNSCEDGRSD